MEDFALDPAFSGLQSFPEGRSKLSLWARSSPILVLSGSVIPLTLGPWLGNPPAVSSSVGMSPALPGLRLGTDLSLTVCALCTQEAVLVKVSLSDSDAAMLSLMGIPASPHSTSTTACHPLELGSHTAPFACQESISSTLYPAEPSSGGIQLRVTSFRKLL